MKYKIIYSCGCIAEKRMKQNVFVVNYFCDVHSFDDKKESNYSYMNDSVHILRKLRNSRGARKQKGVWNVDVGSGFIKDDLSSVSLENNGCITFLLGSFGKLMSVDICDLNCREVQEAIDFLENQKISLKELKRYGN